MENNIMLNEFLTLALTAKKIVPPSFLPNHTYYIFKDTYMNNSCYVLYSYKKGSSYNIFGTHWFYYHDLTTGNFIESFNGGVKVPTDKQRILKKDLLRLHSIKPAQ